MAWGMLAVLLMITIFIFEGGIKGCRICNYIVWATINIIWFITIPAAALLLTASVFSNDLCFAIDSLSQTNCNDFGIIDTSFKKIIDECSIAGDGNILNVLKINIIEDMVPILENLSVPANVASLISLLGVTQLKLPEHENILESYKSFYSNYTNLEIIYGSSLTTLLINAGAELSAIYNPTTIALDGIQCPLGSTHISTNDPVGSANNCIIIKENLALDGVYGALKIAYLYNFRRAIYENIMETPQSLYEALISPNAGLANAIGADVNSIFTSISSIASKLNGLVSSYNDSIYGLNCTIIGKDISNIMVGVCGYFTPMLNGCAITMVISSISTGLFVIFVACYNKSYSQIATNENLNNRTLPASSESTVEISIRDIKYGKPNRLKKAL
jgi:hypothetical protein